MNAMRVHTRAVTVLLIVLLVLGTLALVASFVFDARFVERHLTADHQLGPANRAFLGTLRAQARFVGIVFVLVSVPGLLRRHAVARWLAGRRDLLFGLLTLGVTLVLIVVAGEIITRVTIGRETHGIGGQDPGTIKLVRQIPRNSEGFRDKEWRESRPEGVFRILVLGDSFTFGAGVPETDSLLTRRLEATLNARGTGTRFEVLNAGHSGWNTKQEWDFLVDRGLDFHPDLVILAYVINDAERENTAFEELKFLPDPYESWIKRRSYLYYFVESRTQRLFERLGLVDQYSDYLLRLYRSDEPYLSEHRHYLEAVIEDSRRHDAEVLFLIWPIFFHMDDYPFTVAHDLVKSVAAAHQTPVLDLLDVFRGMDERRLIVNPYNYHPNEYANAIAAQALARTLTDLDLIPAR